MRCPLALLLLALACTEGDPAEVPTTFPPPHPFLADSPWPTTHGSPWAQSSSARPGLDTPDAVVQLTRTLPSVSLAFEPDGTMLWASNPLEVSRVRVADPPVITATADAGGRINDLVGGAYTFLDADGRFHTVLEDRIQVYEADGPEGIAAYGTFTLPDPEEDEVLRGLGLTWDGVVVTVTSTGRVVAVDRDSLTPVSAVSLDGSVSNSLAVDEDGGIYVVTSEAMHRVQWTGEALSTDERDGAWTATYEAGSSEVLGGRLGAGSGSTPSLMTVGDDHLVVITDAQPLMHVVAFWRDDIPEGWQPPAGTDPRTAAQVPVTFGDPAATSSESEQSVTILGDRAVVVNNDYGDDAGEGFTPVFQGVAPLGIEQFRWDAEADVLTTTWVVRDLSCPNGIPSASDATGLMYCVGRRDGSWTIEAIDWMTGEPAFHVPTGPSNDFNSIYAATEIGPDGEIWSGTSGGILRVRPTR